MGQRGTGLRKDTGSPGIVVDPTRLQHRSFAARTRCQKLLTQVSKAHPRAMSPRSRCKATDRAVPDAAPRRSRRSYSIATSAGPVNIEAVQIERDSRSSDVMPCWRLTAIRAGR